MALPNIKAARRQALRDSLWPGLTNKDIWHLRPTGFAMVPRVMPWLFLVMDRLSVGKPVSAVYFDLWCQSFEESFVEITAPVLRAFACGFTGPRAVSTWNSRMKSLKKHGFIDSKQGAAGEYQYVLIRHPYKILGDLHKLKQVDEAVYRQISDRFAEVGVNLDIFSGSITASSDEDEATAIPTPGSDFPE
jgi:hypothetical protein